VINCRSLSASVAVAATFIGMPCCVIAPVAGVGAMNNTDGALPGILHTLIMA
jgi:hypothetical protein